MVRQKKGEPEVRPTNIIHIMFHNLTLTATKKLVPACG